MFPNEILSAIDLAAGEPTNRASNILFNGWFESTGRRKNANGGKPESAWITLDTRRQPPKSTYFGPRVTPLRIAEALGHESSARLDELRRGDAPLTFFLLKLANSNIFLA